MYVEETHIDFVLIVVELNLMQNTATLFSFPMNQIKIFNLHHYKSVDRSLKKTRLFYHRHEDYFLKFPQYNYLPLQDI